MVLTIFLSLVATLTDKGVTRYISLAEMQKQTGSAAFISWQTITLGLNSTFNGWSTSIYQGDSIVDAMKSLANNTRNIPDANPANSYIPHSSDYQIQCNQFNFGLSGGFKRLLLGNQGCLVSEITFPIASKSNYTVIEPSLNRWSFSMPNSTLVRDAGPPTVRLLSVPNGQEICKTAEMSPLEMHLEPKEGMSTLPVTLTKKCSLGAQGTAVMSVSTMWFSALSVHNFSQVLSTTFQERDELILNMEEAVKKVDITDKASKTLLIEGRILPSSMDAVLCLVWFNPLVGEFLPSCLYMTTSSFTIFPQQVNPILSEIIANRSFKSESSMNYLTVVEHIFPRVNGNLIPTSIDTIRNGTISATQYMATLAYNVYANLDTMNMFILFDVFTSTKGIEIPEWLVISVGILMGICLCMWILAEKILDKRYTCSLFRIICMQMYSRTQLAAPTLMRCKVDPIIEFEGILIGVGDEMGELSAELSRLGSTDTLL
ncbi:hypothetical protein BGZ49_006340 [Haplosporangium sp. Z 27]|nr:hypothetical protein BGZ49_006340 [Haplosporangium sp. Z 27]